MEKGSAVLMSTQALLPRERQRLRKRSEFVTVTTHGRAWFHHLLVLRVMPNDLPSSRTGITVSKNVGGAVVRNRIRRRLHEILYRSRPFAALDLVFSARRGAAQANFWQLQHAVETLISRASAWESSPTVRRGKE